MLDTEAPDRCTMVIPHLFLVRVEPDALRDDGFGVTCCAPDGEGAFEAHGKGAVAVTWGGILAGCSVEGCGSFEVGRDVPTHVEALHGGCLGARGPCI